MATRRWSSKVIWVRSGSLRGSVYWAHLVSGRFGLSKTIIPEAQEHFLTLQHVATLILSVDWGLVGALTFHRTAVIAGSLESRWDIRRCYIEFTMIASMATIVEHNAMKVGTSQWVFSRIHWYQPKRRSAFLRS